MSVGPSGTMGVYVLVAFIVPVQAGLVFPRSGWPLHIAVVRFDSRETAEFLSAQARRCAYGAIALWRASRGADAQFGRDASVTVSLPEPAPVLHRLHTAALEALRAQVHLPGAQHDRSTYRPRVTRDGEGLRPGTRP